MKKEIINWLTLILLVVIIVSLAKLHYKIDTIDWDVRQLLGRIKP